MVSYFVRFCKSIFAAANIGQQFKFISGEDATSIAATLEFLNIFCIYLLYAFVIYLAHHAITLLMRALASIVQNTEISTNIAMYNANGNNGDRFSKEVYNLDVNNNLSIKDVIKPIPRSEPINTIQNEETEEIVEEKLREIYCAHCGKLLAFPESTEVATCPYCDKPFLIK